jgi:hypothetical protein
MSMHVNVPKICSKKTAAYMFQLQLVPTKNKQKKRSESEITRREKILIVRKVLFPY